jgi:hypothetical protein
MRTRKKPESEARGVPVEMEGAKERQWKIERAKMAFERSYQNRRAN